MKWLKITNIKPPKEGNYLIYDPLQDKDYRYKIALWGKHYGVDESGWRGWPSRYWWCKPEPPKILKKGA